MLLPPAGLLPLNTTRRTQAAAAQERPGGALLPPMQSSSRCLPTMSARLPPPSTTSPSASATPCPAAPWTRPASTSCAPSTPASPPPYRASPCGSLATMALWMAGWSPSKSGVPGVVAACFQKGKGALQDYQQQCPASKPHRMHALPYWRTALRPSQSLAALASGPAVLQEPGHCDRLCGSGRGLG